MSISGVREPKRFQSKSPLEQKVFFNMHESMRASFLQDYRMWSLMTAFTQAPNQAILVIRDNNGSCPNLVKTQV